MLLSKTVIEEDEEASRDGTDDDDEGRNTKEKSAMKMTTRSIDVINDRHDDDDDEGDEGVGTVVDVISVWSWMTIAKMNLKIHGYLFTFPVK